MPTRLGRDTLDLPTRPAVAGFAAVAGKKEGEGPLARYFDRVYDDNTLGEQSWEKAESLLQKNALELALGKAGCAPAAVDYVFAGDLLNQCIGSTYGLRGFEIPMVGLFGACSTMALALSMAAVFVDGGAAGRAAAVTSSHFCTAERQFRQPLEYGGQRPPSAQWTVTGAGAAVVAGEGEGPYLHRVTVGRMTDYGQKDANNMGAAMAPAAARTIRSFLEDTGTRPADYDLILTGDLGKIGSALLLELLAREGIDLSRNHADCGTLIFDLDRQDVHAGGSGCGCSASVLCSYILGRMREGTLNNVLFCATGALMSTTSSQQGESIPGIAHLVQLKTARD